MKKRINSFKYAFQGLGILIRSQPNFVIQLVLGGLGILCGVMFNISRVEWMLLIFCIGFVITLEAINTSIEYIVDFISPEYQPMAGKIKDLSAAAVLLSAITAAVITLIIFIPYVIDFLF